MQNLQFEVKSQYVSIKEAEERYEVVSGSESDAVRVSATSSSST